MPFRSLLLAVGLSALLAGCGSEDSALIPQEDADTLSARVAEAGDASSAGECETARRAVREAEQLLSGLPRATDRELKQNLRDWLEHLDGQIADECEAEPAETATVEPTAEPTEAPTAEPTEKPTETPTPSPTATASPEPTATVDPGTGGEQGPPEQPDGSGGVPPGDDG